jgi:hypothetical protein
VSQSPFDVHVQKPLAHTPLEPHCESMTHVPHVPSTQA